MSEIVGSYQELLKMLLDPEAAAICVPFWAICALCILVHNLRKMTCPPPRETVT